MLYHLLTIYLTGMIVIPWTAWLFRETIYWRMVIEIALWPIAFVVGTIRKLSSGY